MYQKSNYDMPFCGLSVRIKPTGKQAPKYEFSADASKVKYTCSITKRKFTLSQVNEWFMTPEVQKYTKAGYVLKYMTKTQEMQNPSPYAKSNLEQIFCLVMVKPYKPNDNVDGLKPVGQSMPQVQSPAESMDDEIPF